MPAVSPDLLWLVVHYRSPVETAALLSSLARQTAASAVQVIVVDNSGDAPTDVPQGLRVQTMEPERNLGYFGGASWALARWRHDHPESPLPPWVVVSNADILLPEVGSLDRLLNTPYEDDVLIVAPNVIARRGRALNPHLLTRPSSRTMRVKRRTIFSNPLTLTLWTFGSRLRPRRSLPLPPAGTVLYAPHGSVVLLRRPYFERGGTLDHSSFLYSEEIFLGETVRRLGGRVVFDPDVCLHHSGHVSTGWWRFGEIGHYHLDSFADVTRRYFSV